jgi:pimeloyl-ACP methyl ester carboxylesterase
LLCTSDRTGSDIDIAVHEVGRGEPVLLVHGLGDDHRAWRRAVAPLMLSHRVVLMDFRGHGGTSLGQATGTLGQLAADVVTVLDALGLDDVTLAGFSLGGTIAMRAALDHPDRVRALALVGTSSRVNTAARDWYLERAALVDDESPTLRETLDADTGDVYRNRPEEISDGLLIRRQSTADPRGFANACRAMAGLKAAPLDPELGSIKAPTTVLAGDADQHCPPRAAEIIAAGIPGADLRVLSDTGHPIPVERPAETADAIATAVARAR